MTDIYLEAGQKKVVAFSLEWPGWCRIGKNENQVIQKLWEAVPRYRVIAQRAGLNFEPDDPVIVERVEGDAGTDWGMPSIITASDTKPLTEDQARRNVALLRASWTVMDEVVAASPIELRKGPRGGGRDRDKIVAHVIEAERVYARKIGVRHKPFSCTDLLALKALREEMANVLSKSSNGEPLTADGWPSSHAIRRITWHIIDHIWEIEDRRA